MPRPRGLDIAYEAATAEELAARGQSYDAVLLLEVVEHVPDVPAFLKGVAPLVKPGGVMILSTLNRTLKAYALAIVGAEYILRWLPVGTHQWERFVKPEELASALSAAGLSLTGTEGLIYDPFRRRMAPQHRHRRELFFYRDAGVDLSVCFRRRVEWLMIFRQLFDSTSSTYTYLLASRHGGEALIIDPVLERVDRYIQLLRELDLRLVKAIDTHLHADHITGLEALRERTECLTVMGEQTKADVVSIRVTDGDRVGIEGLTLDVAYTPGHTDDSYSYLLPDRVFTGDTLLIRGTGRTDFQNGDPRAQYESLFGRLLKLPDETLVYPAHDYKGDTVSTIGEERAFNPRLQVTSIDDYVTLMNSLNLPNPKMMDVAVPANMHIGLAQKIVADRGWALTRGRRQGHVAGAGHCAGRPA